MLSSRRKGGNVFWPKQEFLTLKSVKIINAVSIKIINAASIKIINAAKLYRCINFFSAAAF